MKNEQLPIIDIKVKQPPVLFTKTQALIAEARAAAGRPARGLLERAATASVCHTDVVALYRVLERLGRRR